MASGPLTATIFTVPLELVAIVAATVTMWGGAAGAWCYIKKGTGEEIQAEAAKGAAAGFIVGLEFALTAMVYLLTR